MISYRNKHKAHMRQKNLERHIVDQGVASLSKQARLAHEKQLAKEEARFQNTIAKAMKTAKVVRNLEQVLAERKARGVHRDFEDSYYYGYACYMPIKSHNHAYRTAILRCHISEVDMHLLVSHPEEFPNPELVFDLWGSRYYITWEGK